MIPQNIQSNITAIWNKYIADNKIVLDTKGNEKLILYKVNLSNL